MVLIFIKDHLRPEGAFEKTSEAKQNYRDHSPGRPVIHKLKDHLKVSIFEIKMLRKPQYDCTVLYSRICIICFNRVFISMFLMYMNVLYLVSKVIEYSHNHRKVSVTHLAYLSVQKETSKLFKSRYRFRVFYGSVI